MAYKNVYNIFSETEYRPQRIFSKNSPFDRIKYISGGKKIIPVLDSSVSYEVGLSFDKEEFFRVDKISMAKKV